MFSAIEILKKNSTGLTHFHYELYEFIQKKIIPDNEYEKLQQKTVKIISNSIEKINNIFKVKIYGSFPQGLSIKDSDIDFTVIYDYNLIQLNQNDCLSLIKEKLIEEKIIEPSLTEIIYAKIPIIRSQCVSTKIKIDININHIDGIKLNNIINEHINCHFLLKYSTLLLKYLLKKNHLNEVFYNGMNSILLFELVFYFCQYCSKRYLNYQKMGIGEFIVKFLIFYCYELNSNEYGISLRFEGNLFKKNKKLFPKYGQLCVEYMLDCNVDIGSVCNFKVIKKYFKKILNQIKECNKEGENNYLERILNINEIYEINEKDENILF